MPRSAAATSVPVLSSAQMRVRESMAQFGIEIAADIWVWPHTSQSTHKQIDWATYVQPLSKAMEADAQLGWTLRWLCACWLTGCGGEFASWRHSTTYNRLCMVHRALSLLLSEHSPLEVITPREVQELLRRMYFDHSGCCRVKERTIRNMIQALRDLYRFRAYLPSSFSLDPFLPAFVASILAQAKDSEPWTASPEPVCLELIRQAVRLLGTPADDIIRLRQKYILACESAKKREHRRKLVHKSASRRLRGERFATLPGEDRPWTAVNAEDPTAIKPLVAALEGACAVVLLFLSGPRVSEVQRAGPGCLRYVRHSNGIEYPYYFAQRSKQRIQQRGSESPTARTSDRGWILGPAGTRALEVLDKLSRLPRAISGVNNYWVSINCSGLWTCTHRTRVTSVLPSTINERLNVFAQMIGLAEKTGWLGRLHSHMGRKACARFIAKRDRRALADLSIQFGHLSAYITDSGYARPDAEYLRLLDDELAGEMQSVARDLAVLDVGRPSTT